MKNIFHLTTIAIALIWLSSCQQAPKEFTSAERTAVADTINMMMDEIIAAAEAVNAAETYAPLMMDSTTVYYMHGTPFTHCEVIAMLDSVYAIMDWQKLDFTDRYVHVLGPDAALWIANGTITEHYLDGREITYGITDSWLWKKQRGKWGVYHLHESGTDPMISGTE